MGNVLSGNVLIIMQTGVVCLAASSTALIHHVLPCHDHLSLPHGPRDPHHALPCHHPLHAPLEPLCQGRALCHLLLVVLGVLQAEPCTNQCMPPEHPMYATCPCDLYLLHAAQSQPIACKITGT